MRNVTMKQNTATKRRTCVVGLLPEILIIISPVSPVMHQAQSSRRCMYTYGVSE